MSQNMKFKDLCQKLERITDDKRKKQKGQLLRELLQTLRDLDGDIYSVIRLLIPNADRKRLNYGIKEIKLAKIYVQVLGLCKNAPDAELLIKWKNGNAASDFASALYKVLVSRSTFKVPSEVTVLVLNKWLDELSMAADNIAAQTTVIRRIFESTSPLEQKWISRIIIKTMRGFTEETVLKAYHPDANEAFQIDSGNLELIIKDYKNRPVDSGMEISLLKMFKPMLAKRTEIKLVQKEMKNKLFWMETKLDGERMLMHKLGSRYMWHSRNSTDYTTSYGEDPSQGVLTPFIHDLFSKEVDSCVLDGEMCVYDIKANSIAPFGSLKTAINDVNKNGINAALRPYFIIFDCLFLNGKSLQSFPLRERHSWISKIIIQKQNTIEILPHDEGKTANDVIAFLDRTMLNREEGMIIKNPDSTYVPAERKEKWLKLKADYVDYIGETLDVLIIGGLRGQGRRSGKLSHFMFAIIDDRTSTLSEFPNETRYLSFGKVGSGYSDAELPRISRENEGNWKQWNDKSISKFLLHANNMERADMYIDPKHAQVVAVSCFEIVQSTQYSAGYSCRFPRFKELRPDKGPTDCLKYSELKQFLSEGSGKMHHSQRLFLTQDNSSQSSTALRKKKFSRKADFADEYRAPKDLADAVDNLFIGIEFNVNVLAIIQKDEFGRSLTKHDIESLIAKHGGSLVQNAKESTTRFMISDKINMKTKSAQGRIDVVKSCWVLDCIKARKILTLISKYVIYLTNSTIIKRDKEIDRYGNPYYDRIDAEYLKIILTEAKDTFIIPERSIEKYDALCRIENEFFTDRLSSNSRIFLHIIAYYPQADLCFDIRLTKFDILSRGGLIRNDMDSWVTHVILDPYQSVNMVKFSRNFDCQIHFVSFAWINESVASGKRLDERPFAQF